VLPARSLRRELAHNLVRQPLEVDGLSLQSQLACVEAREIEQVDGELLEPRDLRDRLRQELAACGLVEVLVVEQLEEASEGEEGRPQLVRRVRDECPPGVVELRQLAAHALEGTGELRELVA